MIREVKLIVDLGFSLSKSGDVWIATLNTLFAEPVVFSSVDLYRLFLKCKRHIGHVHFSDYD